MVCFQTKNPNFGKIWRALEWKMLLYFMTICNILWPFGIVWYILRFGIFGPRKIWQPWCRSSVSHFQCKLAATLLLLTIDLVHMYFYCRRKEFRTCVNEFCQMFRNFFHDENYALISTKKWIRLHFVAIFFHKLIRSPCLSGGGGQGCQIFLDTIYQNEGKYTKLPQHYQMAIKYTKWPYNFPNDNKIHLHFSIPRPAKIYPNWDFWFENKPSGNPGGG
jgi:hypothetical protein